MILFVIDVIFVLLLEFYVGMNAAVRAAARFAMFKGCHVFGIKEVANQTVCLFDCLSICLSVSLSLYLYLIRDLFSVDRDTMVLSMT